MATRTRNAPRPRREASLAWIHEIEDPRAAFATLQLEIGYLEAAGKSVPDSFLRLARSLSAECASLLSVTT